MMYKSPITGITKTNISSYANKEYNHFSSGCILIVMFFLTDVIWKCFENHEIKLVIETFYFLPHLIVLFY